MLGGWSGVACAFPAATDAAAGSADPAYASGGAADFDRSLLAGAGQNTTDLSRFEHGNPVLAGTYSTDIYLNNSWAGRTDVRFAAASAQANATPCVDSKLLGILQLHPAKISDQVAAQLKDPAACVSIASLIPGATMSFDMANLRLDTSVPQAYLGEVARGYVDPQFWDHGINAGLLNYNFNSYHSSNQGQSETTTYLGLDMGVNLGPWLLREDATVTWTSASGDAQARRQWQNIEAYVQRDLPGLRSRLTLGDSYTDGAVFDSYQIRGVQLGTDDRMLPQSLQGYAPVIHGVAQTNAKVAIRQNGVLIYQTTVSPGPFVINDLYPTGYGGSLDVTVTEANGQVSTFSVPYASVAQLLRPGITRFDIAAGELINAAISNKPVVLQATVQRGFNNFLTGYAGLVGSNGYAAALVGAAVDTRLGALAVDLTQANTHIPGYSTQSGQSMRITYSKLIPATQTTFSVAAYRYSTGGFLTLEDAAQARNYAEHGINAFNYVPPTVQPQTIDGVSEQTVLTPAEQAALAGNPFNGVPVIGSSGLELQRNSFTLTLNQRLGQSGGSLFANTSISDYWNEKGTNTQFQVGYNNSFHRLTYSISAIRSVDPLGRYDNQYMVSFSLPLGHSAHAPTFTLNVTHDQATGSQDQGLVNGTFGSDNQFNYGAAASYNSGTDSSATGSVNGGYRSPYALFDASYGKGSGYSQASVGINGSIVAHPGGVTFGQPLGDTVGIVYVPGAGGARLNNSSGARISSSGYAVVPDLMPYSLNTIQIDPKGLPLDVQLDATSAQVAPYEGAIVMLKFKTSRGRTLIVRAHLHDGEALPFGAEVFDEKGVSLGVVGQAGQILLRGVNQEGRLTARWQDDAGAAQSCSFAYHLAPNTKGAHAKTYEEMDATCERTNDVALTSRSGK
ncbi:fimbria/pilus outer membrane usher protein [Dyella jejuensis]|uniref:fimbria/pilus outer membrane usher protein n=1 Tax=Dyella jejuensis TaxID=1432009 RepID=UPI00384E8118